MTLYSDVRTEYQSCLFCRAQRTENKPQQCTILLISSTRSSLLTMNTRVVYALIIINKAGGLIYQRDFAEGLNKLSVNDYLVLAGTFHGFISPFLARPLLLEQQLTKTFTASMQSPHVSILFNHQLRAPQLILGPNPPLESRCSRQSTSDFSASARSQGPSFCSSPTRTSQTSTPWRAGSMSCIRTM